MANKLYTEQATTQIATPAINPLIKDVGGEQLKKIGSEFDELAARNAEQAKRNYSSGMELETNNAMNEAFKKYSDDPKKLKETLDEIDAGLSGAFDDPQEKVDFMAKNTIKKDSLVNQAQKVFDKNQDDLLKQNTFDSVYSNMDMMTVGFDNMISPEGSDIDVANFKMGETEAKNAIYAKDKDGLYLFSDAQRDKMERDLSSNMLERFKTGYDSLSKAEQQKMSKSITSDSFSVAKVVDEEGNEKSLNIKDYVSDSAYQDIKKYVKQKEEKAREKELKEWNLNKRLAHMDFVLNPTQTGLDSLKKINPDLSEDTIDRYTEMIKIEPNLKAETGLQSLEEAENKISYLATLPTTNEKENTQMVDKVSEFVYDLKKANINGKLSNDDVEKQTNLAYRMANDKVFKEQVESIYGQPGFFTKYASKLMGSDVFKKVEQLGIDTLQKTTDLLLSGDAEGAKKAYADGQRQAIKVRYSRYVDLDQMESLYKEGKPAIFMMNGKAFKFAGYGLDDVFVEVDPQTGAVK